MTTEIMRTVINTGNSRGSALKELCLFYGYADFDVAKISDDMANEWLRIGGELMTHETTMAIKKYSEDPEQSESLIALMNYYGVTSLRDISERQGLAFLKMLQRGFNIGT